MTINGNGFGRTSSRRMAARVVSLCILGAGLLLGGCNNDLKDANAALTKENAELRDQKAACESERAALQQQLSTNQGGGGVNTPGPRDKTRPPRPPNNETVIEIAGD